MKTVLAGILLLAVFTSATESCEAPVRITGNLNVFVYNVNKEKAAIVEDGTLYYDKPHRRISFVGGEGENKYKIIRLFEERRQFVIQKGKCKSVPLTGPFQDMGIPSDASLVNGGRIGTQSNGLLINRYAGQDAEVTKYITTFTQKDCLLTSRVALAKLDNVNYIGYVSLTGASMEFDDSVFEVPHDCPETAARARRSTGILENLPEFIGI